MSSTGPRLLSLLGCLALSVILLTARRAEAQQANVGVPFRNVGHSFYENVNLGWGLSAPGGFFRFNAPAPPPFGGFDPNAQASAGGRLGNGFFSLSAGQGSNTSFGSQTVSGNMIDGSTLIVGDASLRPFVTSVIPIVASDPSPLRERLRRRATELQTNSQADNRQPVAATESASPTLIRPERSSAAAGDLSVASIRASQSSEDADRRAELETILAKARSARDGGKPGLARIYYQQALRRTSGDEAQALRKELADLMLP